MTNRKITLPAFDITYNEKLCFISKIDGKQLKELAKVSRADAVDAVDGYQRHLEEKRGRAIGQYIDEGNLIPGSIILSYKDTPLFENNQLTLTITDTNFLVLDGQHRLFGAFLAQNNIELPICILCNLSLREEIQYFLDINSNQKGVSRTLQQELTKYLLDDADSPEAIRLELFDLFYSNENSPLLGRMTKTQSVVGKISHVPFEKALTPLLNNTDSMLLKMNTIEQKYSLIRNYLSAFSRTLNELHYNDKILTTSAFFEAIFKIFDKVCTLSYFHFKNLKEESIYEIVSSIKTIDLDKFSGSNQQTISRLSTEMSNLIDVYIHTRHQTSSDDIL